MWYRKAYIVEAFWALECHGLGHYYNDISSRRRYYHKFEKITYEELIGDHDKLLMVDHLDIPYSKLCTILEKHQMKTLIK